MFVEIVETRQMRECLKPVQSTYLATDAASHVHTELDCTYELLTNTVECFAFKPWWP